MGVPNIVPRLSEETVCSESVRSSTGRHLFLGTFPSLIFHDKSCSLLLRPHLAKYDTWEIFYCLAPAANIHSRKERILRTGLLLGRSQAGSLWQGKLAFGGRRGLGQQIWGLSSILCCAGPYCIIDA